MLVEPVYLYIKRHNVTGLMYFGKTIKPNPDKYTGSGKYWLKHLKKHGKDISTIFFEKFDNKEDLIEFAEFFSEEFDIINSDKWANLVAESGLDGWTKTIGMTGKRHSVETRLKMSAAQSGENNPSFGKKGINSPSFGRIHTPEERLKMCRPVSENNPNYGSKRSDEVKLKMSIAMKGKKKINFKQIECPHCGKIGKMAIIKRWHFNRCKSKGVN